jgi:hypothetical protein
MKVLPHSGVEVIDAISFAFCYDYEYDIYDDLSI